MTEQPELGPLTQRFMDHLGRGLDAFDLEFEDYNPIISLHETKGIGILMDQVKTKGRGRYTFKRGECRKLFFISITEEGIGWPYIKSASIFPFSEDQTPEECALLILSGIARKLPIYPHICDQCCEEKCEIEPSENQKEDEIKKRMDRLKRLWDKEKVEAYLKGERQ